MLLLISMKDLMLFVYGNVRISRIIMLNFVYGGHTFCTFN